MKATVFDKYFGRWSNETDKVFDAQKKQVLSAYNNQKALKLDIGRILLNKKSETKRFLQIFSPLAENILKDASKETFDFLGVDMELNIDESVKRYIANRNTKFAISTTDTTNDAIRYAIEEGITLGESREKISQRIADVFDSAKDYRTNMIAQSEVTRYNAEASELSYIESGIVEGKEWIVNPDACEFCIQFEGKVIELGESFADKGDTINAGDSEIELSYEDVEHPPLHPNCR